MLVSDPYLGARRHGILVGVLILVLVDVGLGLAKFNEPEEE